MFSCLGTAGLQDGRTAGYQDGRISRLQDIKTARLQDGRMARLQDFSNWDFFIIGILHQNGRVKDLLQFQ